MSESYTTLLSDNDIARRCHLQKVRFVDIYDMSFEATFQNNTSLMITQPVEGFAREGHGNGIRILFDRELRGETARELILRYADSLRKAKHPLFPQQGHEYSRDDLLESLETENPAEADIALKELRRRKGVAIDDASF